MGRFLLNTLPDIIIRHVKRNVTTMGNIVGELLQ